MTEEYKLPRPGLLTEFFKLGSLLVSRESPDFPLAKQSVALITSIEGSHVTYIGLNRPVETTPERNEQRHGLDLLYGEEYIDDANEIRKPIRTGITNSSFLPEKFSTTRRPRSFTNFTEITMIHKQPNVHLSQCMHGFQVARGFDACRSLCRVKDKIVLFGKSILDMKHLNDQFQDSANIWEYCIPATQKIVLDTSPEKLWEKAHVHAISL